jgi:hypothetical protein
MKVCNPFSDDDPLCAIIVASRANIRLHGFRSTLVVGVDVASNSMWIIVPNPHIASGYNLTCSRSKFSLLTAARLSLKKASQPHAKKGVRAYWRHLNEFVR